MRILKHGRIIASKDLPADATAEEIEAAKQELRELARRLEIAEAMVAVEAAVGQHFPEALDALKATLAAIAVGCLSDNAQPTALILVGVSGAGKTLVVMLLTPADDD